MPEVTTQADKDDRLQKLSGRNLDAAVAERVMGWQRQPDYNYWMSFPAGESFKLHALIATWRPFESIEAAMEVVEKVRERGYQVSIRSWEGAVPWSVKFILYTSREEVEEDGDSLPEAICRAALAAIESQQK